MYDLIVFIYRPISFFFTREPHLKHGKSIESRWRANQFADLDRLLQGGGASGGVFNKLGGQTSWRSVSNAALSWPPSQRFAAGVARL
jgi:hypothetical protein